MTPAQKRDKIAAELGDESRCERCPQGDHYKLIGEECFYNHAPPEQVKHPLADLPLKELHAHIRMALLEICLALGRDTPADRTSAYMIAVGLRDLLQDWEEANKKAP